MLQRKHLELDPEMDLLLVLEDGEDDLDKLLSDYVYSDSDREHQPANEDSAQQPQPPH